MNSLVHAIIGLALSEALMLNPLTVVIGALLPDLDYLLGITHRTITHSLPFLIITCLIAWKLKGKRAGLALLVGLSSHLIIDSLTLVGVPLLYPLNQYYGFNLFYSQAILANLTAVAVSIIVIINKDSINEYLFSLKQGQALKGTLGFISGFFVLLLFFPINKCPSTISSVSEVLGLYSESSVSVKGSICGDINLSASSAGNNYQVFTLCDDSGNITVWKGDWVLENNLSKGDIIELCGKFTTKFAEPEIYYVERVIK